MIWTLVTLSGILLSSLCSNEIQSINWENASDSIKYKIYNSYDALEKELFKPNDEELLVINFWATWCAPCIKELPFFEELNINPSNSNLRVILVSLDFENQIQKKFVPFIEKHQLKSELAVLLDGKANSWIPRVSEEWSGAIPATLFIKGDHKIFVESSFESIQEIKSYINQLN